jgi:hypothetical protein
MPGFKGENRDPWLLGGVGGAASGSAGLARRFGGHPCEKQGWHALAELLKLGILRVLGGEIFFFRIGLTKPGFLIILIAAFEGQCRQVISPHFKPS